MTTGGGWTNFTNNVLASSTAQTATYNTTLTGPPGCVVTIKLTTYTHSNGSANYEINGVSHVLNDTVNLTLDSTGHNTFTQLLDVGTTTSGNAILVVLTITAVSIKRIGNLNTQQNSKAL